MLHYQTVESGTLSLLKKIMSIKEFSNFYLVGGTALALKHGHRISVDLDLFTNEPLDIELIIKRLQEEFKADFIYENQHLKYAIFCYIQGIKVDFVFYNHPIIAETENIDAIRMYADKDIAAMKINAILGRGNRKDFYDLAELLKKFTLTEIISFHKEKFPNQMLLISIPNAICYFDDADNDIDPLILNNENWDSVKNSIKNAISEYLK
jgi:hypothetical protein